jgi:predicted nucleotidyltransferase
VAKSDSSIRDFLLTEVLRFVRYARSCKGVRRVAIVGSLAREKSDPKDADVLVVVEDNADLTPLASAGRRLKGRAQSKNRGADIFLADIHGNYIGRTCHWRECRPGIRASCDARHCGRRAFLHDDLDDVTLDAALINAPPLELWPNVVRRTRLPQDVEQQLVQPIEAEAQRAHAAAGGA